MALVGAEVAVAANPKKLFPEFATQRDSLARIVLLADVVEVVDAGGGEHRVYLDECRKAGDRLLGAMAERMSQAGWTIERRPLLAVGLMFDSTQACRVFPSWKDRGKQKPPGFSSVRDKKPRGDKPDLFPLLSPPFYSDSTLCVDDASRQAWASLLRACWRFERRKDQPPTPLTEATAVRDALGAEYVCLLMAVCRRAAPGAELAQGILGNALGIRGGSGHVGWRVGIDLVGPEGTQFRMVMLDSRDGRVLWADRMDSNLNVRDWNFKGVSAELVKRMAK